MVRFPVLLFWLLATLVLAVSPALSADIKMSGHYAFTFQHVNRHFQREGNAKSQPDFSVWQRLRTRLDIVTSPALRATTIFDIDSVWGSNENSWNRTPASGGALGTDGNAVKIFASYIDWLVPGTKLRLRMGKQVFTLPYTAMGTTVFADRGYGISFSHPLSENMGLTGFWVRARNDEFKKGSLATNSWATPNDSDTTHDSADYAGLVMELKDEGYKISPWLVGGRFGRLSAETVRDTIAPAAWAARDDVGDHALAWWAGLTGTISAFSPLSIDVDLNYGNINGIDAVMNRSGWIAAASVSYKTERGTPRVTGWYASGDDANINNGSERIPSISPAWATTSFGFRNYDKYSTSHGFNVNNVGTTSAGTWGVNLELADIRFLADVTSLEHVFRVQYMRGTNDPAMSTYIRAVDAAPGKRKGYFNPPMRPDYRLGYPFNPSLYLTSKDDLWEVNFDTLYEMNKNLRLLFELGFIRLNLDENVWATQGGYKKTITAWH